ncbi:hypothetical protein AB5J49_41590 [Streptomyces sp. R28]|uniref:Transposase n=1 Tax=Streptomyces sp. R28 TaxID=3238628 RepID=A0AB39Q7R9_9ACTN
MGGRKRHLVVDCLGLGLGLVVAVTAAGVRDREAAVPLLERLRRTDFSIRLVGADGGHAGRLVDWAVEKPQLTSTSSNGGGRNAELADALTSSGARLRDPARHARGHGAVVRHGRSCGSGVERRMSGGEDALRARAEGVRWASVRPGSAAPRRSVTGRRAATAGWCRYRRATG